MTGYPENTLPENRAGYFVYIRGKGGITKQIYTKLTKKQEYISKKQHIFINNCYKFWAIPVYLPVATEGQFCYNNKS